VFGWRLRWFEFAEAEVAAATATATTEASSANAAHQEECLARRRCHDKVGIDIFLAKLLANVQTQRSIIVVNVLFCLIAQHTVRLVDFFEFLHCLGIVRIFVRVILQRQLPVRLLDLLGR
jgi:hypothetical protein